MAMNPLCMPNGTSYSQAAQHAAERTQLSSKAARTACLVLQELLGKSAAEVVGEVLAGGGVGALTRLMSTSCAAAASSGTDADLSLEVTDMCAACLDAVMSAETEEAVRQVWPNKSAKAHAYPSCVKLSSFPTGCR